MSHRIRKFGWMIAAVAIAGALSSCGGGKGTSQPPPPPPPPPPLIISSSTLTDSFYGEFYSATLQATGGTGIKTWTISSGSLPRGLNLDHSAGIISGVLSDEAQGFSG